MKLKIFKIRIFRSQQLYSQSSEREKKINRKCTVELVRIFQMVKNGRKLSKWSKMTYVREMDK